MSKRSDEPMLEMFIFETAQLLEQLELIMLGSEKSNSYSEHDINEIFRIMHTIKGSAAMMNYNNISSLAHSMEDIFYYVREEAPISVDFSELTDLVLKDADFIKTELKKIEQGGDLSVNTQGLIDQSQLFLKELKEDNPSVKRDCASMQQPASGEEQGHYIMPERRESISPEEFFKAIIYFEEGCGMENVRAFSVIHNIKGMSSELYYYPANIVEDNETDEIIRKEGFKILIRTDESIETVRETLQQTAFIKKLEFEELDDDEIPSAIKQLKMAPDENVQSAFKAVKAEMQNETRLKSLNQSMISVNLTKLDKLMDLVGELVISEAMVTQNPDLQGLSLENFSKSARHLKKITGELQDIVMSMRMVPLAATFQKMNRIVRDMCKKLDKNVELEIIGEQTEVDKNIIEHISDPLIHIIRNALDHGIEAPEKRVSAGKSKTGKITLEAKNAGGDVLVIVKDDGRGLDREGILEKAGKSGLIKGPEDKLTDRDVFSLIFLPGFSTSENVTEFSGRGVGMDVVKKNIEKIGGMASIDSIPGQGTTVTIRIPLTLAIIDGMNIKVGNSVYTVPITSIRESLKPEEKDIIKDPDGNEMIIIRGQCYPILRLHRFYKLETSITNIHEGIIIMVEDDTDKVCIFVDALLGEQEVVVKALPKHINRVKGLAGCTLLGDGSISLILDVAALMGAK